MNASESTIAAEILESLRSGRRVAPPSFSDRTFDVPAAYRVLGRLHGARRSEGWRPLGRKIGFTNRTILARYGVDRPMWSHVWDRSVTFAPGGAATIALDGLQEPRIEPEVVLKLAAAPPAQDDAVSLLSAVEWIAAGFEIVHSVFPGWKFAAPDCTAAFGLHGALVVGSPLAVTDANRTRLADVLARFEATLRRADRVIDTGTGANVLGSPLNALAHLRDVLATQPEFPRLAAGEVITTGTLTDAWPVEAGETWTSEYGELGIAGLAMTLR